MTLQLVHSEFPYIRGKFYCLFYQCVLTAHIRRVYAKSSLCLFSSYGYGTYGELTF
jgi:hypothetical protein